MTEDRRVVLVAYDVVCDRRRERLATLLSGHGDRIQYSVFLVEAKPARLLRLRARITAEVDLSQDSVLMCDLGAGGEAFERMDWIGQARAFTTPGSMVI